MHIGIINNMAPVAMAGTERQFHALIAAAAQGTSVPPRLSWYRLVGKVPAGYGSLAQLRDNPPDALIVTGVEPRAARLDDEPFWGPLTEAIDWAAAHTASVIFSCLAAHAAVLYLDGIERVAQPGKIFGVFTSRPANPHPLLTEAPASWQVAHSRWNDLPEAALRASGYDILAVSDGAGVDICAKQVGSSLFIAVQGHMEYEPWVLQREYHRDVERFAAGRAAVWPGLPQQYFSPAVEAELIALRLVVSDAARARRLALYEQPIRPHGGKAWAVQFYRRWLRLIEARRDGQADRAAA